MTEKEWLESSDAEAMAEFVGNDWDRGKVNWVPSAFTFSDRKYRLLACGCCRLAEGIFNPAQIHALEAAELFVEGRLGSNEFGVATREFGDYYEFHETIQRDQFPDRTVVARHLLSCACLHPRDQAYPSDCAIEAAFGASFLSPSDVRMFRSTDPTPNPFGSGVLYRQLFEIRSLPVSGLIRDVFGNPFRPVAFDPRWRTGDTVGLARGIYDDRAFDRLPLLADTLMDAGCADEQVLSHCRSEGPHVRGCWVVDLVLGRQ